ncbi:Cyclic pyranopterin monophosphate synthase [Seminavis robusta]|uniref:cyclic pyranopterin monophosphate synthase n=1 Tax=Seminavis robusta TaxID=568900 RepID=A0A9N8D4T4_9STRA|nr:Cyclic pyranopterin monophosphate synthase [Seminavis robusta]|eukprot:Sro4_g003620.1 Cyclic pyranopterin monophosphate synthase (313) ;mRNA; f:206277-207450
MASTFGLRQASRLTARRSVEKIVPTRSLLPPAPKILRPPLSSRSLFSSSGGNDENNDDPHALFKEQMEQLKSEREDLFGFTQEDQNAWGNLASANDKLPPSLMESVQAARLAQEEMEDNHQVHHQSPPQSIAKEGTKHDTADDEEEYQPSHGMTHLSEDGSTANMVDVGHKVVTQRTARAETRVILPPEVVDAFQVKSEQEEVVGPKGAVFATARIAGIMAAKKTSDLIPLCHPLPLDKVHIDIRMEHDNTVLISCECRVTHKTGVEMEALTGASVAALTVYDMLKALSHNIRIEQTVLVSKSGGKRTVGPN